MYMYVYTVRVCVCLCITHRDTHTHRVYLLPNIYISCLRPRECNLPKYLVFQSHTHLLPLLFYLVDIICNYSLSFPIFLTNSSILVFITLIFRTLFLVASYNLIFMRNNVGSQLTIKYHLHTKVHVVHNSGLFILSYTFSKPVNA